MRRALTLALALVLLGAGSAFAAPAPQASLTDLEDEVMCPVCGTPLTTAEAPQADREREFIRGLIRQGRTKDQIKTALVAEYGEDVLAEPGGSSFGWAAWAVPLLVLLVALATLGVAVPRWRTRAETRAGTLDPDAATPAAGAPTAGELARLDAELRG